MKNYLINPLQPSSTSTFNSGGTSDVLKDERKNATFPINKMTMTFMDQNQELNKKKNWYLSLLDIPKLTQENSLKNTLTRQQQIQHSIKMFSDIHQKYRKLPIQSRLETSWMSEWGNWAGSANSSFAIFGGALRAGCDEEQISWWADKAMNFEYTGCYAQTELGHGSNIRALQTRAQYDKKNQQFILNTPTLQSIKWWPGALGIYATHAIVYANLILDGKELGFNGFMVQLRDENFKVLPGVEVGDIGSKIGDQTSDTGYLILKDVRIPRRHMLAKIQYINEEGQLVQNKNFDKKAMYASMMFTRIHIIYVAFAKLAKASTIATRYSCIRKQGYVDSDSKEENPIINYQAQKYKIIKQISTSYALKAMANEMTFLTDEVERGGRFTYSPIKFSLQEYACLAAALKAYATMTAFQGTEDCRQSCGGNGYLLHSGLPQCVTDCQLYVTAEGDYTILNLFACQYLLKTLQKLMSTQSSIDAQSTFCYYNRLLSKDYKNKLQSCFTIDSKDQLEQLSFLEEMLIFRALKRIGETASKIQKEMFEGDKTMQQAANQNALLMIKSMRAHSILFTFQCFKNRIQFIQDHKELSHQEKEQICDALKQLCLVYGLVNILDDDWQGVLHHSSYELVQQALFPLLDKIRPNIIPLTDSFDFPDFALNSSIGSYNGNVYESLLQAARSSELNSSDNQPFYGYKEYLEPLLNKKFLALKNQNLPNSSL